MAKPSKAQVAELWRVHTSPEAASERLRRSYGLDSTRVWVREDGYRLSDRVWHAEKRTRKTIDDLLRKAIAEGTDALIVADSLEAYLLPELRPLRDAAGNLVPGQARRVVTQTPNVKEFLDSPRPFKGSYSARRLARTEISRAHAAATEWTAQRTPFGKGVKWNLSGRHPKADPCNGRAETDIGLGSGVYPADSPPQMPLHPMCLCFWTIETEDDIDKIVADLRKRYRLDEA